MEGTRSTIIGVCIKRVNRSRMVLCVETAFYALPSSFGIDIPHTISLVSRQFKPNEENEMFCLYLNLTEVFCVSFAITLSFLMRSLTIVVSKEITVHSHKCFQ